MKRLGVLLVVTALSACAGISVNSDWDTSVDFSHFETFYIMEQGAGSPPVDRFVAARIRSALAADLTAKGFRQVDSRDAADLAFGYQVTTEQRSEFQTIHTGWGGYGFGTSRYSRWGGTIGTSTTHRIDYTVGTLIIAGFSVTDNEMIWQSSGTGVVNPSSSADASQERMNDAIRRILQKFPPGSQ